MSNVTTREAKVRIGFDIDKEKAKQSFSESAKAAEQLEKAIDKVQGRFKQTKEEFATSKTQVISNAFGLISKAAQSAEGDVAKLFQSFAVFSNVIGMFGALNGSIQNAVRSLKEMKGVSSTLTHLQGAQYAGGGLAGAAGIGAAGAVAGRTAGGVGATIAGAAIGTAGVNAAGQFATSRGVEQVTKVVEQAVEKIGAKAASKAGELFTRKAITSAGGIAVGRHTGPRSRFAWDASRWDGEAYNADFEVKKPLLLGREVTLGEYTKEAMGKAWGGMPRGGFMEWLRTESGSPKNQKSFLQGGLAGGAMGGLIGGIATGTPQGALAGAGLGSSIGSLGNLASGGAMLKGVAALATPVGAAFAAALAAGASALLVKGGPVGDALADKVAGFFVSIATSASDAWDSFTNSDKHRAKVARQKTQADMRFRESRDEVLLPIMNAREQALQGLQSEQAGHAAYQQALAQGTSGAGLDASIMFGAQGVSEASQRLIAANNARYGGRFDPAAFATASQDFETQMAAQRQLTDLKISGQLGMLDPEIARARSDSAAAESRLAWMDKQKSRVGPGAGGIKAHELGFTEAAYTDQLNKAEQATRRLADLERQRVDIKKAGLEAQKQEFAVFREQVHANEQAARNALDNKRMRLASAKEEFALMSDDEREQLVNLAKEYKEKGFAGLSESDQRLVASKQNFFGGVDLQSQLGAFAQSKGFNSLADLLPGLAGGTKKEEADLKLAQSLKVEVERNITAQLGLSEQKLAEEMATKLNPLIDKVMIYVNQTAARTLDTAMQRLSAQAAGQNQAGQLQR